MNARESVLSGRARELRWLCDHLERYPRDAVRLLPNLEKLVAEYVALVKEA